MVFIPIYIYPWSPLGLSKNDRSPPRLRSRRAPHVGTPQRRLLRRADGGGFAGAAAWRRRGLETWGKWGENVGKTKQHWKNMEKTNGKRQKLDVEVPKYGRNRNMGFPNICLTQKNVEAINQMATLASWYFWYDDFFAPRKRIR